MTFTRKQPYAHPMVNYDEGELWCGHCGIKIAGLSLWFEVAYDVRGAAIHRVVGCWKRLRTKSRNAKKETEI